MISDKTRPIVSCDGTPFSSEGVAAVGFTREAKTLEQAIRSLTRSVPGVIAVEKCFARKSGPGWLVDIHIEVDGSASVAEGHSIGHRVRDALWESDLRVLHTLVHIEPASTECDGKPLRGPNDLSVDPRGGFYFTSNDHEKLLTREKPAYDGAEPSGNSAAVMNLLRLYEFTSEKGYLKRAEKALKAFEGVQWLCFCTGSAQNVRDVLRMSVCSSCAMAAGLGGSRSALAGSIEMQEGGRDFSPTTKKELNSIRWSKL